MEFEVSPVKFMGRACTVFVLAPLLFAGLSAAQTPAAKAAPAPTPPPLPRIRLCRARCRRSSRRRTTTLTSSDARS